MALTASGNFLFPGLPSAQIGAGVRTPIGTIVPPGANIAAYVRSAGAISGEDPSLSVNGRVVKTLAAALPYCRSGKGDYIVILPGHTENVTSATALTGLVAGTRIVGIGNGSIMPTFTWTATAAQWAISVADVVIAGLKLDLSGANGVVKAINWTGAGGQVNSNEFVFASGAALKATIALEVGTGANRFTFANNLVDGTTDIVTSGIKVVAAVDRLRITDNEMSAACTAASGLVEIGAVAATNIRILRNYIANTAASSTACISVGAAASTGIIADNYMSTLNNGTAASQGVTFGAGSLIRCFQNFSSDEPQKSGALAPAVVAT